jgi:hypothetical protein
MQHVLCVQVTVHRDKLRMNNQLDASNIQNLFCRETLHVSGIFCAHHQVLFQPDSSRKRSHNLHETYQLPSVQLITHDDGHRRWPKHIDFRDKINFGYLMHLVGYLYECSMLLRVLRDNHE